MSVLAPLLAMDISVTLSATGKLQLRGSNLDPSQKAAATEYAKAHKPDIIEALSQSGSPGQCESCPAAGYWDCSTYAGQGLVCFHRAYCIGKPGKPDPCDVTRTKCPLMKFAAPVTTAETGRHSAALRVALQTKP